MKKILLPLMLSLFVLSGCSKDDEESVYSDKQQKALSVFNGTFSDYQYSNLGNALLGEPDMIVFGAQYPSPIELRIDDFMDGSTYMGEAHGECTYKKKLIQEEPYEDIECYYEVSYDAEALTLYRKSDKEIYHHYALIIESPTEFKIYQSGLSLPYIFKKQ